MGHGLFDERVSLDEHHRYYDSSGNEYVGFSKLFDMICKPFDSSFIAKKVADSKGISKEDVLNEWGDKRDSGVRVDDALTLFNETGLVKDENADIKELILSVSWEYEKYAKNFSQVILYDEESRTAGTTDRLFLFTHQKTANFGISDFKCFEKDDLYTRRGWLLEPFNHLPHTKFIKIAFQLSFYAHHFEKLTGKKCNELFIHVINPPLGTHQKIAVPYLKNDVKLFLEYLKPQIESKTTKVSDEMF